MGQFSISLTVGQDIAQLLGELIVEHKYFPNK